jgi:hypothetical protein
VGYSRATISDSYATGNVTSSYYYAGGLVGTQNAGTINNSYSTGSASGVTYIGGFIGTRSGGSVNNSYSVGAVISTGSNVGGFIGYSPAYVVDFAGNSYWDIQTSGRATSAGGAGIVGKTTTQMKLQATFTGWDFADIWAINTGYPYLK